MQLKTAFHDAVKAHLNRPVLHFIGGWPRYKELREDGTDVEIDEQVRRGHLQNAEADTAA
ncbi:hypothetical protein ACP4OV_018494 [Aristida adscensionis]